MDAAIYTLFEERHLCPFYNKFPGIRGKFPGFFRIPGKMPGIREKTPAFVPAVVVKKRQITSFLHIY